MGAATSRMGRHLTPREKPMAFNPSLMCIGPMQSVRDAITAIDRNEKGIVLITDTDRHLLGTVTDGDVRRAILAGQDLDEPIENLLKRKAAYVPLAPVTARVGTDSAALLRLMQDRVLRHVPLIDAHDRVVEVVTLEELIPSGAAPVQAVIMAGGLGTRLAPLTADTPKPMLPVGGRPVMELIVERLQQAGIRRMHVTTHYRPEKIVEHFGDGRAFDVEIEYLNEERPLGTGGALGLLPVPREPVLVVNGDILTDVNYRAMVAFHKEHGADLTVAVRRYDFQVPYGVIECSGLYVQALTEKPQLNFLVNAGIYLLEPAVFAFIPTGQAFDMTDLIQRLLANDRLVVSFPIREYWLDIGEHADYIRADADAKAGRLGAWANG